MYSNDRMAAALSTVSQHRGAPMGRVGTHPDPEKKGVAGKTTLQQVRLNSGGYDSGGAYWGLGAPLYYWETPDGESGFTRGYNRRYAKEQVLAERPDAVFFR